MLDAAITELESAVIRGDSGEETAFISAASQLRKTVGTGRGNDLLERVIPQATLHRPPPIPEHLLELMDAGPSLYYRGVLAVRGLLPAAMDLKWQRNAAPIPLSEWRDEVMLIAASKTISLGQFIQEIGNQEGSHADEEFDVVLEAVEASARSIVLGDRPVALAPALALSIGEYVVERTRELLAAN